MTEFENQSQTIIAESEIKPKKSKKKIIIISAVVAVILAIAAVVAVMMINREKPYEAVIDKYIEALNDKDVDAIIELMPQYDAYLQRQPYPFRQIDDDSYEILYKLMEKNVGENVRFSYEIKEVEKTGKEALARFNSVESDQHDYKEGILKYQEITAAFAVKIDLIVEGDAGIITKKDAELTIIEQNGEWKLHSGYIFYYPIEDFN